MKAASKELTRESSDSDQAPVDPFAVDMFATESSLRTTPVIPALARRGDPETSRVNQRWDSHLPRVTSDQLEASAALTRLRPETYSQVKNSVVSVLSRYSMNPPEDISVSLVDLQETNSDSDQLRGVFATFIFGPEAASISIELDEELAIRLVDRMLGGEGAPPEQLRSLTTTERAVIEFLYLSAVSELNLQSGQPLVRLRSVGDSPARPDGKRGLLVSLRIGVGEITGAGRVYLNRKSLPALDESVRQMQAAIESSGTPAYIVEELPRYARVAPDVSLAVVIGKTDVTPQELSELEAGDVMVVEAPVIRWRRQQISGSVFLRVGDGDETWISGELSGINKELNATTEENKISGVRPLAVRVDALSTAPPSRFAERLKMEQETETVEAPGEGASLIDAVMVSVHVELAARRLSLDELSRLRKNQILDLGCSATDPVDLVVDGRRIATGELVDIEGSLGVRVTKVLG